MKEIKFTKRYEVHFRGWGTGWILDTSFNRLGAAKKYVRKSMKYQPFDYRVVDTDE